MRLSSPPASKGSRTVEPLRIAHVGPSRGDRGGMAAVLRDLGRSPLAERWRFDFFSSYSELVGPLRRGLLFAQAFLRVGIWCLSPGDRIVHVHTAVRGSWYRKAAFIVLCRALRRPVVLQVHSGPGDIETFWRRIGTSRRFLLKGAFRLADRVLSVSEASAGTVERLLGLDGVLIVPNPAPAWQPPRAQPQGNRAAVEVLYLGGFENPAKGGHVLVEALPHLLESATTRLDLTLAGPGEAPFDRGLQVGEGKAEWVGWLDDDRKRQALERADIVVFPSLSEGLPVALLEAMMAGRAIVATRSGGMPEVLEDGREAVLVPPQDATRLADAIASLADDPVRRAELGQRAHDRAARLNEEQVYGELDRLYKDFARDGTEGFEVRTARTPDEVLALREEWQAMRFTDIEADLERFLRIVELRADVHSPCVLVAERDGVARAMLLAHAEERDVVARFGYADVHRARVRCLRVVHGGVAGPGLSDAGPALVCALLELLARGETDAILFSYLDVASPVFASAHRIAGIARRPHWIAAEPHWICELPDGTADCLARIARRKASERYARRLERELGDRLEVRHYHRPEDFERVVADLEAVAARTYQRGLAVGFDAARDKELVRLELERGWFTAWVLYVDEAPRAFEAGTVYGDTYFLGAKGYDPDWAPHRVGNYVALRAWNDLCNDDRVHRIDFGYGDADYKREAATSGWREANLMIHAPTLRGVSLNAMHSITTAADRAARRLAGPEQVARVKRRWRTMRTPVDSGGAQR
jgi:glycosyltransferase involved in cell wall biosynthesis